MTQVRCTQKKKQKKRRSESRIQSDRVIRWSLNNSSGYNIFCCDIFASSIARSQPRLRISTREKHRHCPDAFLKLATASVSDRLTRAIPRDSTAKTTHTTTITFADLYELERFLCTHTHVTFWKLCRSTMR